MESIEKKDVTIVKKVDDLPSLSVDRESIEMVVLNILTNAYDAIQKAGNIDIIASQNGGNINIRISDSGVGMSETGDFLYR